MLNLLLLTAPGALLGTAAGFLAARWVLSRRYQASAATLVEPADPFISAELDRAAVKLVAEKGLPEASAGLIADKLHLLYALGRRRKRP
jgi:hypothetical protein